MDIAFFDKAAGCFPDECFSRPVDIGIMLGSGWSDALTMDKIYSRISYGDIPGLGSSTVKGHAGEFILYQRGNKRIAAWCGRRHFYEGVGWESVVLPVEILRRMSCQTLIVTNAAGGINSALRPGDFVIIRDHINTVGVNPLVGAHFSGWGERFPDMTEVYNKRLSELMHASANRLDLRAMDGVYAYTLGPCYETPAEINSYKFQGADVVGMSTVPEAVFAKACGFKIAGLSFVSNLAAGISRRELNHQEVVEAAAEAKNRMKAFFEDFISRL